MRKPSGKLNFFGILLIVLIFYGGFVAFKFIASNVAKGQLKTDIENMLGQYRGPDFTEEEGVELIAKLLYQNGIITESQRVTFVEDAKFGDVGIDGSDSEADNEEDPNQDKAKKVVIKVRLKDRKSKIQFFVQYEFDLDLVIFKSRQVHTIEEEVYNYN